ncbi:MAG: tRNA (adenosine(37)-N6)-threonylcarbamoyltransferase complex ATPase subunit type 1 TsaE [Planctomycetaceae bacterium]
MTQLATWSTESRSEAETFRFAAAIARTLQPGDVLRLEGPLGAGKTRIAQGVAQALGIDPLQVNSPTFTLVQEYDGPLPLIHIDAYRLRDSDEFLELGGDELLESGAAILIEWASRIDDLLPADAVTLTITVTSPTTRHLTLAAPPAWLRRLQETIVNRPVSG